jgi:DNA-binding LacI/PurR family transcriptional regulator
VGPATRSKVLKAASELGYEPNALARGLITGRSRIIGLVLSQLDNLFYPEVLDQLARRLQGDGYHLLMFVGEGSGADDLVGKLLQYRVDGIILAAVTLSSALAQRCSEAGIPVVLFNRIMGARTGSAAVGSVRGDNVRGGRLIAEHLAGLGHRRIAFIAGREDSSTNLERERGFLRGLRLMGLPLMARAQGDYDPGKAAQAALALCADQQARPDAIFVASDQMAIAVMDALRSVLGLSIPQDISIVGFDNVPQASWAAYHLTTFEQPVTAMVDAAASLLVGQLERGALAPRNLVIPGELLERGSTAPKICKHRTSGRRATRDYS